MKKKTQSKNSNYSLAHVLYQKLGSDWYAFAEVDGDCFMTKVSEDVATASAAEMATRAFEASETRAKRKAA
ncbi:MAG: hypothetical protein EOP11_05920 [Proteobacteria bacterium]|nr:MAG: hypothetical protein EOP11_05920 [Pseudomonadota bacterium]